jgi:DnaJ-class molecular chaperone
MDNHYAVLNIATDAPQAVVRAAYRVLAAQFHLDRHVADPAMLQRMQQVTAAYRVLSDPRLRAGHDAQLRSTWQRRRSDGATVSPMARVAQVDAPCDAVDEPIRALARRRAFIAAEYARHASLG